MIKKPRTWLTIFLIISCLGLLSPFVLIAAQAYATPNDFLVGCMQLQASDFKSAFSWFAPQLERRICLSRLNSLRTVPYSVASIGTGVVIAQSDRELGETLIQNLQSKGADINETSGLGLTPLDDAILYDDTQMVAYLLKRGADPHAKIRSFAEESGWRASIDGLDALQYAIWCRDHRIHGKSDPQIIVLLSGALATRQSPE